MARFSVLIKHRLRRATFSLAAVALVLTALELLATLINLPARPRWQFAPMSSDAYSVDDPQLFWRMRPHVSLEEDGVLIETNALGIRDDEIEVPKPPGTWRAICLGESTTFGAGVPQDATYAQIAEKHLNASAAEGERYDIVNAGLSASSSFQAWQWTRRYGEELEPDAIVLYYQTNDVMSSFGRSIYNFRTGFDLTDRRLYHIRNRYAGLLYLLNHSMLYKTLKHLLVGRLAADWELRRTKFVTKGGVHPRRWPPRMKPADREYVLDRFLDWTKAHGAKLLIMNPAYATSEGDETLPMRWARLNNVPVLDVVKLYRCRDADWVSLFDPNVGNHPTAQAHRLMGEALSETLQAMRSGRRVPASPCSTPAAVDDR
ncbi:MAG: SGNH/GDSL hydrolase family protein [Deltaproteobacteria bacterium]|nr:SGNH/GDSL hydrolase family protein [Deltaproteobacteria bacterium]